MRKRLQIVVILCAWLMATGAQWDVVQVFGWTRMAVNYSRTMPFLDAVQRTLGGEMCGVCKTVEEAKEQENHATLPNGKADTKLLFVLQPVAEFVGPAMQGLPWTRSDEVMAEMLRSAPPTPPPRA